MQPIATDTARSMVYMSVCLAHRWDVQKWLNRLWCHFKVK